MNKIIKDECAIELFGVQARAFNVVVDSETGLIRNQRISSTRTYKENGKDYRIVVELRFDDQCGNGHETFAITGTIYENGRDYAGGCIHEEIEKYFPELKHLIKWHLFSTDGPMHYIANTCYHAGDRDCWGLTKDEKRQIINGKSKLPSWELVAVDGNDKIVRLSDLPKYLDSETAPECPYALEYRPWYKIGEGKSREFDRARKTAVWPEATDEQLSLPREHLEALLLSRLPELLTAFESEMKACGFVYPTAR